MSSERVFPDWLGSQSLVPPDSIMELNKDSTVIRRKLLLSIYRQLCVVQYGEIGRWSLVWVAINSSNVNHTQRNYHDPSQYWVWCTLFTFHKWGDSASQCNSFRRCAMCLNLNKARWSCDQTAISPRPNRDQTAIFDITATNLFLKSWPLMLKALVL